ncbi:hypothetical protein PC114_g25178 [Phytophthora cactorum]|uniref:Chromo domain-containing protein n=1 Tax=Phytophthora cactorum TaxID=29920 RepID=A0A8T1AV77_9STRA|nr:hypothetical protein PC114_g25178 [Phytophthora cactorum]KAG2888285.1 hypothetical protein PC117_g24946 [Phytophthora cactorum]
MPSTKPVKSAISSATEFKTLCVTVSKSYKIRVSLDDVRAWLVPPSPANDAESDDEAESSTDEDLEGEKQHYVRKLLNWKHQNRKTYYLVDWEPTWEPREHLNKTLVAAFEKERRLLVRKTFFEDEAVEDNTLNYTEA